MKGVNRPRYPSDYLGIASGLPRDCLETSAGDRPRNPKIQSVAEFEKIFNFGFSFLLFSFQFLTLGEAGMGIAPMYNSFADCRLATWLTGRE